MVIGDQKVKLIRNVHVFMQGREESYKSKIKEDEKEVEEIERD